MDAHAVRPRLATTAALVVAVAVWALVWTTPAHAVISFRSATSASSPNSSGVTIAKPAGLAAGDVMVASVTVAFLGPPVTIASPGWVPIWVSVNGNAIKQFTFYKVATASEPASYDFDGNGANDVAGGIAAYSGVDPTSPVDAYAIDTGSSGPAVAPSVITSSPGDVVIAAVGVNRSTPISPDPTVSERFDKAQGTAAAEAGDFLQLIPGPTGTKTATPTVETDPWTTTMIALRGVLPPAPTFSSSIPASPANVNSPALRGSATAGTTVSIYTDAACTAPAVATGSAAQFASPGISVSVPDDSTTTFYATAADSSGITSNCSGSSLEYVEDSTPPPVPAITGAPLAAGTSRAPTWSFTGSADTAAFQCRLENGVTVVFDWGSCTSPKTYDLTGRPDGDYTFKVRAADAAGNTSGPALGSYTLDTTPPGAPAFTAGPPATGSALAVTYSFSGDADSVTYACRVMRGATLVTDWTGCTSPHDVDLTGQPDGVYTFSVTATDAVGNTGLAARRDYTLDTVAPPAPALAPLQQSPANIRTPAWSFSGEAGAAFECRLERAAVVVAGWAPCSSPASYDLTGQPDGAYTFSVRATDAAGNVGATQSDDYVLDTTAPVTPTIDSAPTSPGVDRAPTWSFSGESGGTFECRLDRGGAALSGWAPCSSPRTYSLASQPDGVYTFSVRVSDAAGNTSAPATDDYTLDTTAPPTPSIATPPSPGNDQTPTWSFSGEAGATFACRLDRGGTVVSAWAACTSPQTFDLGAAPDGTYTFQVQATDAAGNTSVSASSNYTLDTIAPGAPTGLSGPPGATSNDSTPTFTFGGEAGGTFECRLDRGATTVFDWGTCASPHTYDLSAESDGTYTFSVRTVDPAGNVGPPDAVDYILDRTPPTAPAISGPGSPGSDTSPSWSFTSEVGATFECRLDRGATPVAGWTACSSPDTHDLAGQPDATYTFSVRATDQAGNTGPAQASDYILDTTIPGAPTIDASPGPAGASRSPSWSFSGDPGTTFECRLDRGPTAISGWTGCSSPEAYSLAGEPDGTYTFSVRSVNRAGTLSATATDGYALDTTPPAQPTIIGAPTSPASSTTATWTFAAEPGATVECRLDRAGATVSGWGACSSTVTFDLSGEPDGTFTVSLRATDPVGNVGATRTSDYVLDTTPPAAPAFDATPTSPANSATPSWSFSGEPGATLECRMTGPDGPVADWGPCSSPVGYDLSGRADGIYALAVRARDAAGNTGPAAASTYELDRAPGTVHIDSGPGPLGNEVHPEWRFSGGDAGAVFECALTSGGSPVFDWTPCTSPQAYDLSGRADAGYVFAVRTRDAAGNISVPEPGVYGLDTAAPAAPVFTDVPGRLGSDRSPTWAFRGEDGAVLECRLERDGVDVSSWTSCTSPAVRDLADAVDGQYTLLVRARDAAGNTGPPAGDRYELDTTSPSRPTIDSSPGAEGADRTPRWAFSSEPHARFDCRLTEGGKTVSRRAPCTSPFTFNLLQEPDGVYAFAVWASDAAGNTSKPTTDDYRLVTKGGGNKGGGGGGGPSAPPPGTATPSAGPPVPAGPSSPARPSTGPLTPPHHAARGLGTRLSAGTPRRRHAPWARFPTFKSLDHLAKPPAVGRGRRHSDEGGSGIGHLADQAIKAIARNADKAVFPLTLILLVVAFLTAQGRIDRNDPKLALAPVFADPELEFSPPPTAL